MDNIVLAKVGDVEVTKDDMIRIMRNLPQQQQQQVAGVEGRKQLLEEMVAGELLYLKGASESFDQDEKYLELVAEAKKTILQQYTMQKLLEDVQVTDEDVETYYEANKASYKAGATAKASHILVNEEEEINMVKSKIEGGLDFAEAAGKYSTCPSKERGGDLGSFEKGRMVPEFEEVAFTQEIGVVSEPVKTQFGYHLILVEERSEESTKSLEEVAPQIRQEMTYQKQTDVYRAEVDKLKGQYPVEIFEDQLQ